MRASTGVTLLLALCLGATEARLILPVASAAEAGAGGLSEIPNNRPLIGILSQLCPGCPGKSFVSAAYVKWVEQAGARAVPIRFYVSEQELKRIFKSINGLILPGGLTDIWLDDPYVMAGNKLFKWAKAANEQGDTFPIWGTCLGHQLLQILESNSSFDDILIPTDAVSYPSPLEFTPAARDSKIFKTMYERRADLVEKLANTSLGLAMENHEFGMPPAHYERWPMLKAAFEVLTTSKDRKGVEYISTIEHRQYPFFGSQWHPEKPPFEFSDATIPHTHDAISVSQHLANVFIDYARLSRHAPESLEEELALLIYNYEAYFTARDIVMEPSYDGPDITYFLDKQEILQSGHAAEASARSVLSKFNT